VRATPNLPRAARLPRGSWRHRHGALLALLALHVVGVPAVGLLYDDPPGEAAADAVLLGAFVLAGVRGPGGRTGRALAVSLGLLVASALLVEGTHGLVQAHFHFFVVVTALALYEDWRPFLLAIAFVFLWLGLSAALGNPFVDQPGSPWRWAGIHAAYIAALSAVNLVNWRAGEGARREITAAEQRHRALVEALDEGVIVLPGDGGASERNGAAARILQGALGEATVLGRDGRPLPAANWPWTITRLTGEPCTGQLLGLRRPGAPIIWLLASTHALRAERSDAAPFDVLLSFADVTPYRAAITELRNAHRELERRATELERSNADLEQFASVASHDLSEPLRMVSSYLGLLRRRYGDQLGADAELFIENAVDGATRMRALIDDLLAYARVGRGEEGRRAPVDLEASVDATLRSLETTIADAGAEVEVGPLPEVAGDGPLLGQLFQNLIANALKFRGARAPVVRVSARRHPDAWQFAVADNGIGIDPVFAERIFGMFQRGQAGEAYDGTGIGLAICRRIVERHGGRIWVEPTPGGGATFAFTIPDGPEGPRGRTGRFGPRTREDVPAGIR
jgi:signal transduction histidine kinase